MKHADRSIERAWSRETIPFARDLFLIGAILFYLIGFAYQTAKMQSLGLGTELGNPQLIGLIARATEPFRQGGLVYAGIAVLALGLLFIATVVRDRLAGSRFRLLVVYGLVSASIVVSVVGSTWYAWEQGSANLGAPGNERAAASYDVRVTAEAS